MDKLGAVTVREWHYDKQLSVSECVLCTVISRLQIGYCVDRFSAWCFFSRIVITGLMISTVTYCFKLVTQSSVLARDF